MSYSNPTKTVVLVGNAQSGHSGVSLDETKTLIEAAGLRVVATITMDDLDSVRDWARKQDDERPLIVAAGGDGTVGGVADKLAHTAAVLGIIPLGTSNDVARSLGIPVKIEDAAALLARGVVSTTDLGQFVGSDGVERHFIHAATLGLNVVFAKMATQSSLRRRLGKLTYLVAGIKALRGLKAFRCTLEIKGRSVPLSLYSLTIINAPIFGGSLEMTLPGSSVEDRRFDVLAIDETPLSHLVLAALSIALRRSPHVGGVRLYHERVLHIHTDEPLDVSLDGEIMGQTPGDFKVVSQALRVIAGPSFTARNKE